MDIKNCVGQTPFDVADPDVLRLLEELKKKQNNCSKDRLELLHSVNSNSLLLSAIWMSTWPCQYLFVKNLLMVKSFSGLISVHLLHAPQPHLDWARAAEGMSIYFLRMPRSGTQNLGPSLPCPTISGYPLMKYLIPKWVISSGEIHFWLHKHLFGG